ncbi:hypothetical protein ACFL00_02735 [Pseudomonadota bacterium]
MHSFQFSGNQPLWLVITLFSVLGTIGSASAAETSLDCSGIKLEKSNCLPNGPNHIYFFGGSCSFKISDSGGSFQSSYASHHSFPVQVYVVWDAATKTLTEKLDTLGGFEWNGTTIGGRVESEYVCSHDPLLEAASCSVNQHSNDTGLPAFSIPAQQFRPITEGSTTLAEAVNVSTQPSCSSAPPPPPPAPKKQTPVLKSTQHASAARELPAGRQQLPAQQRTFANPAWQDRRIDWCLHWGSECGEAAASEFCRRLQFTHASAWTVAEDVGPTLVLGDNKTCGDIGCDGFASITCTK